MEPFALALLQAVALAALAACAAAAGLLAAPRLPPAPPVEAWTVRIALGLGVAGTLLFAIGLVGGLRRGLVALAVAGLLGTGAAIAAWRRNDGSPAGAAARRRGAHPALGLAAALLPAFVWGLFPPHAWDEVTYHLPYARAFVEAQRVVPVPDLLFPVFPQLAEMLFTGLLLTTGFDSTTHAVQLLATGVGAVLLYATGARLYSRAAGAWAAALWLAHPLVHYQAASAYVDVTLALFCLLALCCWERWRDDGGRRWLVLAGAAAGFATGTKYLGLAWAGVLAATTLIAGRGGQRLRAMLLFAAVAALVGGPWYLRIWLETGNPVHPFLDDVFAAAPGDAPPEPRLRPDLEPPDVATALSGALELPRFVWRASFARQVFQHQAPLAPWNLALLPLALLFARRDPRLLRWLALVVAYSMAGTTGDPRFMLPAMAVAALAGGGALHHLAAAAPGWLGHLRRPLPAGALAMAIAAMGPAYALYKLQRLGWVPPAAASARDDFLAHRLVGHEAILELDRRHGAGYTVAVVGAPYLAYHARGRVVAQAPRAYTTRPLPPFGRAELLHRDLVARHATHLLLVGPGNVANAPFHPLLPLFLADDDYSLYAVIRSADRSAAASRGTADRTAR